MLPESVQRLWIEVGLTRLVELGERKLAGGDIVSTYTGAVKTEKAQEAVLVNKFVILDTFLSSCGICQMWMYLNPDKKEVLSQHKKFNH